LLEARDADLLLHVVDASDPLRQERIEQVRGVLHGIGAGESPELLVFNKIDLLGEAPRVQRDANGLPTQAWISAAAMDGLVELRAAIARAVRPHQQRRTLHVQLSAGAVRSLLYQRNAVREERQLDDGSWELDVELDAAEIARFAGNPGVQLRELAPELVRRGEAA
jgi:GTP-binding protein HflX